MFFSEKTFESSKCFGSSVEWAAVSCQNVDELLLLFKKWCRVVSLEYRHDNIIILIRRYSDKVELQSNKSYAVFHVSLFKFLKIILSSNSREKSNRTLNTYKVITGLLCKFVFFYEYFI